MSKTIEVSDETYSRIKDQLGEEVKEIETLEDLVGETYLFQCARYIYHGKVKSINSTYIELTKAGIVYETGELDAKSPTDKQDVPNKTLFVMRNAVESFYKPKW